MNDIEKREAVLTALTLMEPEVNIQLERVSELEELLAAHINHLVERDFNKLLNILYRIDVSEEKIKKALLDNSDPAGQVMAELIIERQFEKITARKKFKEGKAY